MISRQIIHIQSQPDSKQKLFAVI